MTRKSIAMALAFVMTISTPTFAMGQTPVKSEKMTETVYGILDAKGNAQHIYVVTTIEQAEEKDAYKEIFQLSDTGYSNLISLAANTGVTRTDSAFSVVRQGDGPLYYQGELNANTTALPWKIAIRYMLDGKVIEPRELAGANGQLNMIIDVAPDALSDSAKNFALQLSYPLSDEVVETDSLKVEGASVIGIGSTRQIQTTIMPMDSKQIVIQANVKAFETEGITISAIPVEQLFSAQTQADGSNDNNSNQAQATQKSINSAEALESLSTLDDGVVAVSKSAIKLQKASEESQKGLLSISAYLHDFVGGMTNWFKGFETFNQKLSAMTEQQAQLQGNVEAISNTLTATSAILKTIPSDKLSDEQKKALLQLERSTQGLVQTNAGMSAYTKGLSQINQAANELNTASVTLKQGATRLDSQTAEFATKHASLPAGLNQLYKGTEKLQSGVLAANASSRSLIESFDSLPVALQNVFMGTGSSGNVAGNSTAEGALYTFSHPKKRLDQQVFVLKTASIKAPESNQNTTATISTNANATNGEAQPKGFLEKLLALFGL